MLEHGTAEDEVLECEGISENSTQGGSSEGSPVSPIRCNGAQQNGNVLSTSSHVNQENLSHSPTLLNTRPASAQPHSQAPDLNDSKAGEVRQSIRTDQLELLLQAGRSLRFAQLPCDSTTLRNGTSRPASANPRLTARPPKEREAVTPPISGYTDSSTNRQEGTSPQLPSSLDICDSLGHKQIALAPTTGSGRESGDPQERLSEVIGREGSRGFSAGGCGAGLEGIRVLSASRTLASCMLTSLPQNAQDREADTNGIAKASLSGPFLRGQQLLEDLEAELRDLDDCEASGVAGQMSDWCSEFESVLAKMDRLATGYQVAPDK